MAGIQVQGAGGSVVEAGAFAAKGAHTVSKPQDYGAFGHFAAVLTTGTVAAGAQTLGEQVQMRWVDATRICLIHHVEVLEFRNVATGFTAGRFLFDVCRSTAWSADGSGGAAVGVADPQLQLRALTMGATLFSTGFRVNTTSATGLGAGTKVLDTLPLGACYGAVGAIAAKSFIPQSPVVTTLEAAAGPGVMLFKADIASGEHPIVLAGNGTTTCEGISIRATVPATGTWAASFLVKWAEVTAF